VCNVRQLVPGGDHEIAIAEITAVGSPGGAPLVYYRSGYHALSP
jgi:flavin reductase (DIM6/NTAB) family NADH-FMN oxidoreductase RutF